MNPSIGIIGSGISGLTCARHLTAEGWQPTVYEKSRGPGGRTSTRRQFDTRFDHGAQYFTARSTGFRNRLTQWTKDGITAIWQGRFGTADNGEFVADTQTGTRWVGTPGMNAIARHLGREIDCRWNHEVTQIQRVDGRWRVDFAEPGVTRWHDWLVLSCPGPQARRLVPAESRVHRPATTLEYAPCWAIMLVPTHPLDLPFDGIRFAQGPLAWAARENSKPMRSTSERWVLHASAAWSRRNINATPKEVIDAAIATLGRWSPVQIDQASAHRWLYARCTPQSGEAAIWDAQNQLGLCGDGLVGPRVEDAWTSGTKMAELLIGANHGNRGRGRIRANWQ